MGGVTSYFQSPLNMFEEPARKAFEEGAEGVEMPIIWTFLPN